MARDVNILLFNKQFMEKIMKKKLEIAFFELTEEDLAQYKILGKRSLITRIIFFFLFLPIYIIFILAVVKLTYSYIYIFLLTVFYLGIFFTSYFIYFAFDPVGIRYGRVSKQTYIYCGKYSGYKYNVYFDDIHKSITNVMIHTTKQLTTVMPKDKVKVVKTRFGALYIFIYEYYDKKNTKQK